MTEIDRLPDGYGGLLAAVKAEVARARIRTARVVNTELIGLYWAIGPRILESQRADGWGTRVIDRLSTDLRAEFPGMRGFSARSLVYMRTFADRYPDSIAQRPVAQLPWRHITTLLDKVPDPAARDWYAAQDVEHGWSTPVLTHHITTERHKRVGAAPNNSPQVLPPADSDQTREIVQDPYVLAFLALDPHHSERDLEDALVNRLTRFLAELGTGFAYVGRQYKVTVGASDYFIDLLFYHLRLRAFVVFELKAVAAQPEHIGKLNFYVNVVDDRLRNTEHGDRPTIGILLAADRDDVAVEYAVRGLTTPLAVSTYRALPDDVRPALPSATDLAGIVNDARQDLNQKARDRP
ncbi:PDDEXK nuclease domain-containing protein [Nakamurella lactea]|uniref:PDDEXK nuclease domain-containing protein n=1 Tax=Nakamurella lactea TaxID=459515 RepID=UPI00040421C4|nr:PDDEXK nuclease domain-containing protein [Nakamurella lactea]